MMNPSGKRAWVPRRRGFTFLEILVVVVLLGTLMAMVMPTLGGVAEGARLRSSTRSVANIMKVARTEAILGNRIVEVRMNVEKHTYRLDLREPPSESRAERLTSSRTRNKRRNIEQERALETRVRFDEITATTPQVVGDGEVVVRFFPDGSATPTIIHLINNKKQRSTLEVLRVTGLVETKSGGSSPDTERSDERS
jgi:type II secretion system protein H